jgi:hypothetical protein
VVVGTEMQAGGGEWKDDETRFYERKRGDLKA